MVFHGNRLHYSRSYVRSDGSGNWSGSESREAYESHLRGREMSSAHWRVVSGSEDHEESRPCVSLKARSELVTHYLGM